QYHALIDTGLLAGRRVQLIEGQLIEMPPMNMPHIGAMTYLFQTLARSAVGDRVFSQTPIMIDPRYGPPSEPEPDVYVASPGASLKPHISEVDLIVEVSDSTVESDRQHKVQLYLAAGAKEVWLVDLVAERMLMWRGGRLHQWDGAAQVTPLLKPSVTIDVAALFAAARRP
ncbi:MAG: Uma2 family endonuclease, partial [Chloroflexi bacterium]|nr:Uma2 family endonuclease [Chloroflexota bacterium]